MPQGEVREGMRAARLRPVLHDNPLDRAPALFAGRTTLHRGTLLLPIIPQEDTP